MLNPFANKTPLNRPWTILSDVDLNSINEWKHVFLLTGLTSQTPKLKKRFEIQPSEQMEQLINIVRETLIHIEKSMCIPHVFIFTDHLGVVHHISGSNDVLNSLEKHNIGVGTPFALEFAGINAISMAMQLKDTIVLQGNEHSLNIFSQWSCVCCSIRMEHKVYGYLDLSFHVDDDEILAITLAVTILTRIVKDLKYQLEKISNLESRKLTFFEKCDIYELTNKEKEIAYYWFEGYNRNQLSKLLYISSDTVKSHIRNISKKVGISGRNLFVSKFNFLLEEAF